MSAEVLGRTERLASTDAVRPADLDRARRQAETDERSFKAADARRLGALHGQRREDIDAAISEPRRRGRAEPILPQASGAVCPELWTAVRDRVRFRPSPAAPRLWRSCGQSCGNLSALTGSYVGASGLN